MKAPENQERPDRTREHVESSQPVPQTQEPRDLPGQEPLSRLNQWRDVHPETAVREPASRSHIATRRVALSLQRSTE